MLNLPLSPRCLVLLLLLWLTCLPSLVSADLLAQLPARWQASLRPLAERDLSGAEPHARLVLGETRIELARLLADPATSEKDLAEGYGRLGALYQVYHLEALAEAGYANAMALDPAEFRWVYYAAYHAAKSGRHEAALALFDKAARLNPDYPALLLRRAESLLELNRLDEAANALRAVVSIPGLRARALYQLAQIELLQRRYDPAIEKLEEVLQLDPAADQAHYPLARAWRAKRDIERSKQHMAAQGKQLPTIVDPFIDELQALNQGARQFFAQGLRASHEHKFAQAAEAFERGLEIESENNHARVSLARARYLSGEPEQAKQQLQQVLKSDPEQALARFLTGVLLVESGQRREAMHSFQAVLTKEPEHYGAHFCVANLLFQSTDYTMAAEHYRQALQSNPEISPARLYLVLALKRSGKSDSELAGLLMSLLDQHPQQLLLRFLQIRLLLLSSERDVRDTERARELVNELVQREFIPPYVELQALVAAGIGNFDQAVELQQQVLPTMRWWGEEVYQRAQATLSAYRRHEMPQIEWYRDGVMLPPPEINATLLFREYPSPVPY